MTEDRYKVPYHTADIEITIMRACGMRNSNQILHEGRTILEENFYKIDRAICPGQKILCQEC